MQEQGEFLSETQPLVEALSEGVEDDYLDEPVKLKPITRTTPRVRRNDRCPCGSGRKFKQCCKTENV